MQLQTIANNTQTQLAMLEKKYATPDRFKSTCGVIAIVAISAIMSAVFLNDAIQLVIYSFLDDTKGKNKVNTFSRRKPKKNKRPVYVNKR